MMSELHLPIVLPLVIALVELTFVLMVLLLSRAPGWRALRALVLAGLSAAAYSLAQLPPVLHGVTPAQIVLNTRFTLFAAAVNAFSWLWYIRHDRAPARSTRGEKALAGLLFAVAATSLLPEPLIVKDVFVHEFSFYMQDIHPGPVLSLGILVVIATFGRVFWHYVTEARNHVVGGLATSIAFSVFFAFAIHEALVVLGAYEAPYAIGVGFLVLMFARAGIVARRVADDAALRLKLSVDLEGKVQERTSELVRVKETLMQRERLAALGQLAAGVGHEINNPLTYVLGNLEILAGLEPPLPDDAREIVLEALDGAQRVRKIVRDLRALGKGKSVDRVEPVRLRDAVEGACKLVAMQLRSQNVDVKVEADDSVARLDRGRIGQVLVNLLSNAAAALPKEIEDAERRTIVVRVAAAGKDVKLEVEDRGVGISKEHQFRVFEPFYTTRTDSGGTGLGLYVCHSVIQSYGGTITVESREGEGTKVTLVLPRVEGLIEPTPGEFTPTARGRLSATPSAPVAKGAGERLLVVDDDAPVARAMARLLTGYTVDVAADVAEAKALLDKNKYDAVICDLRMTGASGMVLFGHLRDTDPRLAKRFMLVTGGGLLPDERAELDDFGAPVLMKPVEAAELRQGVKVLTTR